MEKKLFGKLPTGEEVYTYTLKSAEAELTLMTRGATIVDFNVYGKSIIGGFDTLEGYLADGSHQGAAIGRVANRVAGATFTMDNVGVISLVFTAERTDLVITVKYSDLRRTYTLTAVYNEDAKCYITPGIPAAYIDNLMTITVGDAVGTYSLAAYIEDKCSDEEANALYIKVAKALGEYAAAAEAYKYITIDEVE